MKMVKEFIMPVLVLTVICLVVSAALVGTYQLTKPVIDENERITAENARKEVMPDAPGFEQVTLPDDAPEGVLEVYHATDDTGYVITVETSGYKSGMQVMVGILSDGTISQVRMIKHQETQNLGGKLAQESYTSQYIGKDASLQGIVGVGGATLSSNGFYGAVQTAFDMFDLLTGSAA